MAFSPLARLQMLDPLGMLEDVPGAQPAAIANGIHAIVDEGGVPTGVEAVADAIDDEFDDDGMSEPTELEQRERQSKLDHDSSEFLQAVAMGVFNGEGEELYSDQTWRPEVARTRSRPPTPPVPGATQNFELATGNTTPRSMPAATGSSPDLTPKRQRLLEATPVDEVLQGAAAALESEPIRKERISKTLG